MADDVVIRAEGLGKKYVIGHQSAERYTALRDVMAQAAKNFARTTRDMLRGKALVAGDDAEDFWALKDVSFEIKRGDVVGIIGRNGAGKSTLLKVLSRITEPTEGRVAITGRVASLLEVGTGFHPELSGRENIYLNGAILGMARAEIARKFDEIVAFSGVERFLDTPVKRYSSGMYVRLAFAVAAHLEPEILVVDEVLAVGDADFQKKCLGKMKDVAVNGRTVLFVSHNLNAVSRLCRSSLLMEGGRGHLFESVSAARHAYEKQHDLDSTWQRNPIRGFDVFNPIRLDVCDNKCTLTGDLLETHDNLIIAAIVKNSSGDEVFITCMNDTNSPLAQLGRCTLSFEIPAFLIPGAYTLELSVFLHNDRFLIGPDSKIQVVFEKAVNEAGTAFFQTDRPGLVKPLITWTRNDCAH